MSIFIQIVYPRGCAGPAISFKNIIIAVSNEDLSFLRISLLEGTTVFIDEVTRCYFNVRVGNHDHFSLVVVDLLIHQIQFILWEFLGIKLEVLVIL